MPALAPEAAPIADAAGPHIAPLMGEVETRLAQIASSHGAALARHAASTIAAGGKRLRPLLVLVAAGDLPEDAGPLVRAAVAVELATARAAGHGEKPRPAS
jgi:geranylgeranyl pyrophosphate synthase